MTIGYYADIANECQVFHICQPVTYADGETETFKWSMICPEQTVFDQVIFILNISISIYDYCKRYFILQLCWNMHIKYKHYLVKHGLFWTYH